MDMMYYQRYLMNLDGVIYDVVNQKYPSTHISLSGYVVCSLIDLAGDRKLYLLHRLVAEMFVENFTGLPIEGLHVDHIDGNKLNNHYTNLQWLTPKEHSLKSAMSGEDRGISVIVKDISNDTEVIYPSAMAAGRDLDVSHTTIFRRLNTPEGSCMPIKNRYLVKLNDGSPWSNTIYRRTCNNNGITVIDILDNYSHRYYESVKLAAEDLGLQSGHITRYLNSDKIKPYHGYFINRGDDTTYTPLDHIALGILKDARDKGVGLINGYYIIDGDGNLISTHVNYASVANMYGVTEAAVMGSLQYGYSLARGSDRYAHKYNW